MTRARIGSASFLFGREHSDGSPSLIERPSIHRLLARRSRERSALRVLVWVCGVGKLSQYGGVVGWGGWSVRGAVGALASAGALNGEEDVLVVGVCVALEPDRVVDLHVGRVHRAVAALAGEVALGGRGEVGCVADGAQPGECIGDGLELGIVGHWRRLRPVLGFV